MADELLPIKVVLPDPDRHIRSQPGGSERKVFGTVNEEVRTNLSLQIQRVRTSIEEPAASMSSALPAVAKVRLKREALAKSHRPTRILSDETCPVIGVGAFNELYVRATTQGLVRLGAAIARDNSSEGIANISTIEAIEPVSLEDKLSAQGGTDAQGALERAHRIKITLFEHHDKEIDQAIERDFVQYAVAAGFNEPLKVDYAPGLKIWILEPRSHDVPRLLAHRGIRSASVVPRFFPLVRSSIPVSSAPRADLPEPARDFDYPALGIIDSGISATCAPLRAWIMATESHVAQAEQNPGHGTFVAGLVAFGAELNAQGVINSGVACRIVDVIAIPNDDPDAGEIGSLDEPQLVSILKEVVPKFRDRVRVWNLSLGSEEICRDDQFSDLAKHLDSLQAEYDVQFVIAAGNYTATPVRGWPPQDTGGADRITAPADSVLGVTVGALAQAQVPSSVVGINHPAPFSRRGPGPSYGVKPDLVEYGGNCDLNYEFRTTGMRSLFPDGRDAEDIGTSFSTPLVSSLLSNVLHAIQPPPSLQVAKALMIQAADYPLTRTAGDSHYFGFGKAPSFPDVVFASQSSATLVFEDILQPGYTLELDPFPFPACLTEGGKSRGIIKMTLVYSPPLNAAYGLEYCRANVSASLGTLGPGLDDRGRLKYSRQVHPDGRLSVGANEQEMIEHGLKWWPTKVYHREFIRGVHSTHWRLFLELLHRAGDAPEPQHFALAITISGHSDDPVYDDTVAALRPYSSSDLALRSSVQQRFRI